MLGGIKGLGRLAKGRASMGLRGAASGSMGQMVKSGTTGAQRGLTDLGNAGKRYMFDAVDEVPDAAILNPVRSMGGTAMPGRVTASRADYGGVMEARRQAKLASTDPGLSTRGRVRTTAATRGAGLETRGARPMPGSRVMGPSTGGLETRGVRPMPGTRAGGRPIPAGGLENRGTRPMPGTRLRRDNVRQNVANSQQVRVARQQAAARNTRRQKERIIGNLEESKAGNRGGFRRSGVGMPGATASRPQIPTSPTGQTSSASGAAGAARQQSKKANSMFRDRQVAGMNLTRRTQMGILAGGAAAYTVSNRRQSGTSSGAQSTTRY